MNHKYTHIEVGIEFYNLLITMEPYTSNPKAVYPAFYFLKRINEIQDMKDNGTGMIEYPGQTISSTFQPYTKGEYKSYIDTLITLDLLVTDNHYILPHNDIKGKCISYGLTEVGYNLITSCEREYLHKLINDKQIKRQNQINKSKKRSNMKKYNDPILDNINEIQHNIKIDHNKVEKIIKNNQFEQETVNSINSNLIKFETSDFKPLKYNEEDNRISHTWIHLKSEIRPALSYKKKDAKYLVDIRCCHPTFFSSYIISLYYNNYSFSPSSPTSPIVHYDTHKRNISSQDNIKREEIEAEHKKWIELFTNPDIDGRIIISQQLDIDEEKVKDYLNSALNGSTNSVFHWISIQFPNLFKVWVNTNIKKTGCEISKQYEGVLIRNVDNYMRLSNMNLTIIDEHDGFSVMASDNDISVLSKINYIVSYIKEYSRTKFGINLVIKIKMLNKDTLKYEKLKK